MNGFTTIFEYTAGSIRADALYHIAVGAVVIIGGILVWIFRDQIIEDEAPGRAASVLLGIMLTFGLLWWVAHATLFSFAISDITGNTLVAEGVVHVSGVQAYHGHNSGDKITVDGQNFEVDYFGASPGYKQTLEHGGALQEGVYARLHYCNGMILKVEVRTKEAGQQGP
jgi:hypothetical protein